MKGSKWIETESWLNEWRIRQFPLEMPRLYFQFSVKILTASGSALGRVSFPNFASMWQRIHRFDEVVHSRFIARFLFHAPIPLYYPSTHHPRHTIQSRERRWKSIQLTIQLTCSIFRASPFLSKYGFRQGAIQTSKTIVSELCGLRSSKGRAFPCTGSLPVAKQYECLLRFIGVDISFHERNRLRIKLLLLLLSLLFFGWK